MTGTPDTIRDDLRGEFRGELHFDDATRSVFAGDASPLELTPLGVAVPIDATDVATIVRYAHEHKLPLAARGAGTGDAGGCLTAGVVLDLGTHLRGGLELVGDDLRVKVGEPLATVAAFLADRGRRLGPDLAGRGRGVGTVGGAIATDAAGVNAFRHGSTRDLVRSLEVVWDTGETDTVAAPGVVTGGSRGDRQLDLRARTTGLLAEHRELIELARPQTRFSRAGYRLHDARTPAGLDLTRLLVGSEGTLAVVTAATLRTLPLAGGTARTALGFAAVDAALDAGLALLPLPGVTACELLDQRLLSFGKAAGRGRGAIPVPPPMVGAALVVETEADTPAAAADALRAAVERLRRDYRFVSLADATAAPRECQRIDDFADAPRRGADALRGGPRPLPGADDAAVPVEELAAFVHGVRGIARRLDVALPLRVNVLCGRVVARPVLDPRSAADRRTLWAVADAVHTLALSLGGTTGSGRGTGLLRAPWLGAQFGPLLKVFREVKAAYDPLDLLNAGKLFDADPGRPAWPFAPTPTPEEKPRLLLTLFDSREAIVAEVAACNGCGTCREEHAGRMCPVFRGTAAEAATPRAQAALWRAALRADDPLAAAGTPDAEEVARLCVNCKMCVAECPSNVDVPRLALEAKAAHFAAHGFRKGDWLAARVEGLSVLAGTFAFTANALLGSRPTRWLAEKLFGLARSRALPRFTHRTFLRRAWRLKLTGRRAPIRGTEARPDAAVRRAEKVAYFVDLFANFHDPTVGLATVAVLRHHGLEVYVPWRQRGSGMAPLVQGDADAARRAAAANVRTLAPLVREGYRVVCSDPTAALMLTQEYPRLLDTPDARLVAESTVELTAFLWAMHEAGELRTDFQPLPLRLGHHVPCHVKALGAAAAGPRLLSLIPALAVRTIDESCSGMAGTYGLRAENLAASLAAGQPMLDVVRSDAVVYGSTECGACRVQMQSAAGKRTLHPVQYLALAYGLLPELRARLARPLGRLLTDG